MNIKKEYDRRIRIAEKLSKQTGKTVEPIHPNGPVGFMYVFDGILCHNLHDVAKKAKERAS